MYSLCSAAFALAVVIQVFADGGVSKETSCACKDIWTSSRLLCTLDNVDDFVSVNDSYCKYQIDELELRLLQNSDVSSSVLPRFKISRLKIVGDYIENVSETAFMEYNDSLYSLEISQGILKEVPVSALKGLPRLRALLLPENSIHSVNCSLKETPLRFLILRDNEISFLDSCAFPRNLSILSLTNNYIEKLNGSLNGLSDMSHLFINRNRITTLEGELEGLNNMLMLNAEWNKIERIGTNPVNLNKLDFLNVSHNRISELRRSLVGFSNLRSLDLSCNDIRTLKAESFSCLTKLEFLSLSGNSIRRMEDSVFGDLIILQTLIISNNVITSLESKLTGLYSLKKLDASWNHIRDVANAFSGLMALEEINLSNNRILSMSNMLLPLPRLKILNLAWNSLKNINEDDFRGAKSLETLILSGNHLGLVKGTVFSPLPKLTNLGLTVNTISNLDELLVPGFMNISLPKEGATTTSCDCMPTKTLSIGDDVICSSLSIPDSKTVLLQENGIELVRC